MPKNHARRLVLCTRVYGTWEGGLEGEVLWRARLVVIPVPLPVEAPCFRNISWGGMMLQLIIW